MTAASVSNDNRPPATNEEVLAWVQDVAALTTPVQVVFCDGSAAEREQLIAALVKAGTLVPRPDQPGTFRCAPDAADTAQLGRHSYLCSSKPTGAGLANWMEPVDMRIILTEEFRGCMSGRNMYVVPFRTEATPGGPPVVGVQITDSAYVVVSMTLVTDAGAGSFGLFGQDTDFVRCLHSVGAPRRPGRPDVPWPCDRTKYIAQFPESRTIWSYGSGFVGNTLRDGTDDGSGRWFRIPTDNAVDVVESDLWRAEIVLMQAYFDKP